jgi:hypothetical protein
VAPFQFQIEDDQVWAKGPQGPGQIGPAPNVPDYPESGDALQLCSERLPDAGVIVHDQDLA